ncbi:hypothetical protein B0H17DRAFT_1132921, partial [Mycena rosella]
TYLVEVAELFRENIITPSQHAAFHIGEELRKFGPTHPERQNTNLKWGRAANLKALLSDNKDIQSKVAEAIKVYEHGLKRDSRGIRLANMLNPEDSHFDLESRARWSALSTLERHMLHNYLSWIYEDFDLSEWQASASIMDQISISGVRYAKRMFSSMIKTVTSYSLYRVPITLVLVKSSTSSSTGIPPQPEPRQRAYIWLLIDFHQILLRFWIFLIHTDNIQLLWAIYVLKKS